jgi:transcription elongation factor Elf1
MKICTKCFIEKEDECFPFKNKAKNKRANICKECQRVYKLDHYYRNKEAHYNRNKKTIFKLRSYVSEVKKEGNCVLCGEKEISCLDFHHLSDKDMEIARLINRGSLIRLKKEIEKCVLLCANCHRKLHAGILNIDQHLLVK